MKKITILVLVLLLGACQTTQLSSDLHDITFEQDFHGETIGLKIYNLYGINSDFNSIKIQHSENIKVEATVNEALIEHNFEMVVIGDELVIKTDNNDQFSNLHVELNIYGPIDEIEIDGAFNLVYENIMTNTLDIELEGAGEFILSGHTDDLDVSIDGAGSIEAFDLLAREASLELNGAGSIQVSVSDKLEASLDGLGSIEYRGNPTVIKEINGLGTIEPVQ